MTVVMREGQQSHQMAGIRIHHINDKARLNTKKGYKLLHPQLDYVIDYKVFFPNPY